MQIDAFGTGDFIEAIPGEVLYDSSIVRTGPRATAVLEVDELRTELPPSTELHVASLRTAREKKSRSGWLRSAAGAVKDAFNAITGTQEDVVLGGRAADYMELPVPHVSERYAGYTYLILVEALVQTGKKAQARTYWDYADTNLRGSGLDREFDALGARLR